jgi:ribonuclease J
MKVIVHSGGEQIGASCLEISSPTARIILDCGWPIEEQTTELLPPAVPGLFTAGTPPNAVLLSHGHPDHTGFITNIASAVSVYATTDASKIMKVGSIYARGVPIPGKLFKAVSVPRSWRDSTRPFTVGDLCITAYPVDHSSPGAVGYLVEHDGKRIFYTGDLRFHGRKPGMHKRILKDLRGKLDLLITEGTNIGREQSGLSSEKEVENCAVKLSRRCASLVGVAYSPQNLDRFVSFFRAAVRAGRTFVCDHYQAAVLYQLNNSALPKPSRDGLRIYLPRRRRRVKAYESRFGNSTVSLDEILATPDRFMMVMRPSMILNDLSGRLPLKNILLYGMWSGYRSKSEWQEAEQVLASSSGELIECHASGHAHADDLFAFIEDLAPAAILPVHTNAKTQFQSHFGARCEAVNHPYCV